MADKDELQIIDDIKEAKAKYRKVIQAGIAKWVKDFQEGRIKINTVDDLKKLIEMDLELQMGDIIRHPLGEHRHPVHGHSPGTEDHVREEQRRPDQGTETRKKWTNLRRNRV